MDFIVKKIEITKDGKNNEEYQEIQTGQGNGIHLPQTDRAIFYLLEGCFLVKKLCK